MKKIIKISCLFFLAFILALGSPMSAGNAFGTVSVKAAAVKLNKTGVTLREGATYQLKVSGTKKKITWKSKNKKIASVSSKGKVKAVKKGKTEITAKVGKKKLVCTVKVEKKNQQKNLDIKKSVVKLINQERTSRDLGSLKMDDTLNAAADVRAKEIAKKFSHTRPNGKDCFSILSEGKYQYDALALGENIAAGYSDASSVMTGWMQSPGHKANILTAFYNRVGIGYYHDDSTPYRYYWVQIFAGVEE